MRLPNLKSLSMFDAAARHLNFQRAADELSLTQGAVAQQVRHLEADLGQVLFVRKARGLELTKVGGEYHQSVRRALQIIHEATEKLRPTGLSLSISVTPSFASKWLVSRLTRFEALHPEIDLQIQASEGLADFKSDGVDLAIRLGEISSVGDSRTELLTGIVLLAVCSPAYADRVTSVEGVADYAGLKLIQDSHKYWQRLFEEEGLVLPKRVMQFNQTALSIDAAVNGQGVALAPYLLVHDEIKQGRLINVREIPMPDRYGYYIVYPAKEKVNQTLNAVIAWLRAEVDATRMG